MNKDKVLEQLSELMDFVEDVNHFTCLTKEQLHWLFYCICVKDENGKWRDLLYGNHYDVVFRYDEIYIIVKSPLFFDTKYAGRIVSSDKPTPFKKEYLVKSDLSFMQEQIKEYIVFPKYTGYASVLNGDSKNLSKVFKK